MLLKKAKRSYRSIIEKLEEKFNDIGLKVENITFFLKHFIIEGKMKWLIKKLD